LLKKVLDGNAPSEAGYKGMHLLKRNKQSEQREQARKERFRQWAKKVLRRMDEQQGRTQYKADSGRQG